MKETIEQVFERCTSTDFSSRDREEILKAMQEYADLQLKTLNLNDREDRKWFTFEMFRKELIQFALAYHKSDQKDISNDASEWAYEIFNKV